MLGPIVRGRPVRRPYPYDLVLDGHGYMFVDAGKGAPLASGKPPDLGTAAPTEHGYSAQNPAIEKIAPFGPFPGGFGLRIQDQFQDDRYHYATGVDCSAGLIMLGPAITVIPSSVTTDPITRLFEIGGTLYFLGGRYAGARASDASWTVSKDFGVGKSAKDVQLVHSNASGASRYAYVGCGDAEPIYRFDGTTWEQHAEATKLYARAIALAGRDLYRAHSTNTLAKCSIDSDPFVEANWSNAEQFTIGDKSAGITRLVVDAAGALYALKEDGIYTLDDQTGDDRALFPFLRATPSSANGEAVAPWLNDLFLTFGDGTFRLDASGELAQIGPEMLSGNSSPVRGKVTAMAGHSTYCLYAALWNPDTNASYLLKLVRRGDVYVWHGSIAAAFSGKKISAMHVSTIGAAADHSRMYLGFSNGDVGYFALPCTSNPAACSSYRFTTTLSYLYLPTWTATFGADPKRVKAAIVTGPKIDGDNYAQLEYRADTPDTDAYTALAETFSAIRERVQFPTSAGGTLVDFRLGLKAAAATATPQLAGLGISHSVVTDLRLMHRFVIAASDGQLRHDGARLRAGAATIRARLRALADNDSLERVELILRSGERVRASVTEYEETTVWSEKLRQWQAAVALRVVAEDPTSTYGLYSRLETLTYGGLESYRYGQLETL